MYKRIVNPFNDLYIYFSIPREKKVKEMLEQFQLNFNHSASNQLSPPSQDSINSHSPNKIEVSDILGFLEALSNPMEKMLHETLKEYVPHELVLELKEEIDSELKDLLLVWMKRRFTGKGKK